MSSHPTLVWFRHDLRLHDNPCLVAAARRGGPVIPVFIWSPAEEGEWAPGSASQWWLHRSLQSLQQDLVARDSRLIIREGKSLKVLEELLRETGADAVLWNRRYEPAIIRRDTEIKSNLTARRITVESFNASLLHEPWQIQTKAGKPFQVFTPFWKACLALPGPDIPQPSPKTLPPPRQWPMSLPLDALGLEPKIDWAAGLRATWTARRCRSRETTARVAGRQNRKLRSGTRPARSCRHFKSRTTPSLR